MTESEPPDVAPGPPGGGRPATQPWIRRGVLLLAALVLALLLYQLAASFLPRWWARRVGEQAGGGMTAGALWGLFYGFLFTVVPVLVLFQARRKMFHWRAKLVVVAVALVLAAPNWLTLTVVAGNGRAAHAGERIFDVEAPGFRTATLIGVVVGAVVGLALSSTGLMLTHRRRQVRALKEQVQQAQQAQQAQQDPPADGTADQPE